MWKWSEIQSAKVWGHKINLKLASIILLIEISEISLLNETVKKIMGGEDGLNCTSDTSELPGCPHEDGTLAF